MLANVVLDELDWELERRGHHFACYADDCNIMVKSKTAGERVMASVTRFVSDTLRLTVNPLKTKFQWRLTPASLALSAAAATKSAVDRPGEAQVSGLYGQPKRSKAESGG